jgi:hypothetical protein
MLSARSLTVCSIACGLISLLPDFGGARTGENVPGVIENIELHIWLQDEKLSIAGALKQQRTDEKRLIARQGRMTFRPGTGAHQFEKVSLARDVMQRDCGDKKRGVRDAVHRPDA